MGDADYLVLGSYEGHLVGYRLGDQATAKESTAQERRDATETSFALKAHDGCVRAVASGGAYLATCGSDHSISVYNLRRLREHGKLVQQVCCHTQTLPITVSSHASHRQVLSLPICRRAAQLCTAFHSLATRTWCPVAATASSAFGVRQIGSASCA